MWAEEDTGSSTPIPPKRRRSEKCVEHTPITSDTPPTHLSLNSLVLPCARLSKLVLGAG
jgi:hypothetical protein